MNRLYKFTKILLSIFPILFLYAKDIPEPYLSVKQLLPEYPFCAWYTNKDQIQDIFDNNDIRLVIEVGSWLGGGSTRHMGELLKKRQGTLYAVDTWLGNKTQQPKGIHFQPILPQANEQFLSNMIHWDLTDIVVPCKMKSLDAAKVLKLQPDLIYIDAEHTFEAVYADLNAWYPFVKDRGIMCGDDWGWRPVSGAVRKFAAENNLTIEFSGNFWRLLRKE